MAHDCIPTARLKNSAWHRQSLKASLAALYGVASENVVVTRGADDAIDMLVRTFCRPQVDAALAVSSMAKVT